MEDGIADVQPPNLTHGREGEEEEENSSGFLRNFISNMVSAEGGGEEKKEEEEEEEGGGKPNGFLRTFISNMVYAEGGDEKKEEEEEKHNGGIVTNLISNLVSPRSTTETGEGAIASGVLGVDEDKDGGSESVEVKGGGGDGGKSIGNLILELFHHGEASEEKAEGVEEKVETEEEEDGGKCGRGGGIIDNIVSHLPASLQGDAVTSTDEAALLIHSIIHE